jgi:hypothetical protein
MILAAGSKLGPHEIVAPLGARKEIGQCPISMPEKWRLVPTSAASAPNSIPSRMAIPEVAPIELRIG